MNSLLEFMQADIVIETGFISALPTHKEVIDTFIRNHMEGADLVFAYLKWVKKKFKYAFKMSDFYGSALEDVPPVKLIHEFAGYYLQYLECDKMNGIRLSIGESLRGFKVYNTKLKSLSHAQERREMLDKQIKATKDAIIESFGLKDNDVKGRNKVKLFLL